MPVSVPVVIAHFGGRPNYLQLCLESAASFNTDVVLIGDGSNRSFWRDHWNSDRVDTGRFREFADSYVKLSDYPDSYEMAFWKRPFVVDAWMKSEGVKELFLIDSDVLTFADYSKEVTPLLPSGYQAALMAPAGDQEISQLWASLHFSYWTREALDDFTSFAINAYRVPEMRHKLESKYRWHVDNRQPGGVCEMTLLYYWATENSQKVFNLARVIGHSVADRAVNQPANYFDDEYEIRGGFKRLFFRNGLPFGFNRVLDQEVRFWCLHCQGEAKGVMRILQQPGLRPFFPDVYRLAQLTEVVRLKSKSLIRRVVGRS
jgi:hypothetical protein